MYAERIRGGEGMGMRAGNGGRKGGPPRARAYEFLWATRPKQAEHERGRVAARERVVPGGSHTSLLCFSSHGIHKSKQTHAH